MTIKSFITLAPSLSLFLSLNLSLSQRISLCPPPSLNVSFCRLTSRSVSCSLNYSSLSYSLSLPLPLSIFPYLNVSLDSPPSSHNVSFSLLTSLSAFYHFFSFNSTSTQLPFLSLPLFFEISLSSSCVSLCQPMSYCLS
jgi:hypothetical protein